MKLIFPGTRGYIEAQTPLHRRHTCLLVVYRGRRVLVDCGLDWLGHIEELAPHAIVLTHAHPDHAEGLREGAPCEAFATSDTWRAIQSYPLQRGRIVEPRQPCLIKGVQFEAFPVEHSIRCPAVGYRITTGRVVVFYAPDVVYIPDRDAALAGVRLYIGDGATVKRSFVRKRGDRLIGHAPVSTQLTWCSKAGVRQAVITHCGSEIVGGERAAIEARIAELARERDVDVTIAYDGMELVLR